VVKVSTQMIGNLFIKPLVWEKGPISSVTGNVHFDVARTPFGDYKAWYDDGSLWVPQLAEHSKHGSTQAARDAAYEHLCNCIRELVQ